MTARHLAFLIAFAVIARPAVAGDGLYQAGFAKTSIMPDELTSLSCYGFRSKPAEGKVTISMPRP